MKIINKSLVIFTALTVISWSLGVGFFVPDITRAAVSQTTAPAGMVVTSQTIKASSGETPVIKFQVTGTNADNTITQVAVTVESTAGPTVSGDFASLKVWKSADNIFDGGDTPVGTQTTVNVGSATNITVSESPLGAAASWYIVTVATSAGAGDAHAFKVTMAANTAVTVGGDGAGAITSSALAAGSIQALTIDTVAPALNAGMSGPQTGSTNVPISNIIHMGFSENLDQSTLNSANISLCSGSACGSGGVAVGNAIRAFPNGFDLVASSQPSYTAGTSFAKAANTSKGFYFMQGTNVINPQGSYIAPTLGDIVFFQRDTFPMEVGVVTTATLTSGAFSVNDFNLFGGQQIIKFGNVAATGLQGASTALVIGDIVVANVSANPTDIRYNWHIVTAGNNVTDANLRFDGATGGAPTFVTAPSSRISRIAPTATAAVNGSSQTTIDLAAGDLVFAKVTANADKLNQYAWHVVTTAENIIGAIPSALRLDSNATGAPTLAASSQISKLSTAANGAVVGDTTVLSFGDIVFAKTTANATNNGAYNFHMVSAGATGAPSASLRFDNVSADLAPSTTYVATAGVGVKDLAGNPLADSPVANRTLSFTTGSNSGTNNTPPFVQSSTPQGGNQSFPISAPISLQFSVPMSNSGAGSVLLSSNIGLFLDINGAPGSPVAAINTYNSTTNTVTVTPGAPSPVSLTAGTGYIVQVAPTTTSNTGTTVQGFRLYFRTSSGAADTANPTVTGVFPSPGATGVVRPVGDISIGFSEDMNAATITGSTITINGGITGTVSYSPQQRAAHFSPNVLLATNTEYVITVGTGVQDLSGNGLAGNGGVKNAATIAGSPSTYIFGFTTDAVADTTDPTIQFANADNFGISVTFSEPMKSGGGPSSADNVANYTLESPIGTSISLGGKTVTYDGPTMSAKIGGLSLQNGVGFKVTGSNLLQDLSGRSIVTTGSPAGNVAQGTVANSTMTGGQLGPGSGPMQTAGMMGMTPVRVSPMTRAAGATSNYAVEFLVTTSIPSGGTIVLTFPTGFDVTNAAAMTVGTESPANGDINGPAAGTVTIASIANSASARTVTITTGGAETGVNTFLHLDLKVIVNSTVPSSSGYTVDIKTKNVAGTILETLTSGNFFLGQAGTRTLTLNVFNDNGLGGGTAGNNIKDGTEAGIQNVIAFLFSPAAGGQSKTTDVNGQAVFSSLADGDYMFGLDPSTVGSFVVNSAPQPITISVNTTKNYGLSAAPRTISGTVTGPLNTKVDVFASSPNGFVKATIDLGGGGSNTYSLPAQNNTTYRVGVGPSIPAAFQQPGSPPPPPPTFNFMPPQPIEVKVLTGNITQNFALTSAGKTITGTVKDSAGTGINTAQVFARPTESSTGTSGGFGTGAQTDAQGNFTLNVVSGVYMVGVFKPGMPPTQDKQITVPSSGNTTPATLSFVLDANTSSLTISGTVSDDAGNAIPYAGVGGRKVVSTSDTTPVGGDSGNFVGGPTDANGAYTLYVSAGTWVVEAFAPNFGRLGSKTITVATTSLTGQNFSAATLNTGTIKGQATKATVAQQGVMVRAEGANGGNMTVTDASGNYALKVPAGTYAVTCFFPGIGESTPVTGITVTSSVDTTGKDCSIAAGVNITVNLTDGTNPITGGFVDIRDSNGRGNSTNTSTSSGANAAYVVSVPPGTYTVRAGNPSYGMIGSTSSVIVVAATPQTITYTAAVGARFAITGTVTGDGTALANAWVSINGTPTGQTNIINLGTQTAANGTFSISIPNGTYRIRVDKPGYKSPIGTAITVNGATISAGTIALTTASLTITGTVTLNGAGISNAFVDATDGNGGFAVTQTDSTGAYSLPVSNGAWTVRAGSIGYESSAVTVTVSNSNSTGNTLTLTAISGFTVKPEKQETVTPNSGGFFTNSDIGANFKMNIPANALGTSSNASTIKTQTNTSLPNPPTGSILSKNAVTISATDSSGQPIKTLNDAVTITIPYTEADIPSGVSESSLVIGVWNATTNNYDTLSTTVDTTANTLTATTTHFSDFAPLVASGGAPSTPTGFTATALVNSVQVNLSWTEVSGANSYDIYRSTTSDGTFSRVGSEPTVGSGSTTTYSDTSVSGSKLYYYKITSLNTSGESAASAAVSATTTGGGGGGGGGSGGGGSVVSTPSTPVTPATPATPAVPATQIEGCTPGNLFSTTSGKSCTVSATPAVPATPATQIEGCTSGNLFSITSGKSCTVSATPATPATPTAGSIPSTGSYKVSLTTGSKGNNVTALQNFLKSQGVDIYPEGLVTGYFGNLTKAAVGRFQLKNGVVTTARDPGYGYVGPKTRAKINALLGL